jgi:Tfp pilus assembly protein PilO
MKQGLDPKTMGLIALFSITVGGAAVFMQYGARADAVGRVNSVRAELPDEDGLNRELREALDELEDQTMRLAHLAEGIPDIAYIPTMLKELELIGEENGLTVTGVRPIPPRKQPPGSVGAPKQQFQELQIDVTARGDYDAVLDMLDSLRQFPKIVAVETVGMKPKFLANSGDYEHIAVSVRLLAFVFPEKEEKRQAAAEEDSSGASVASLTPDTGDAS